MGGVAPAAIDMANAAERNFTINFGPKHPAAHGVLRRMHANYFRVGGVHQDLPPKLIDDILEFLRPFPESVRRSGNPAY